MSDLQDALNRTEHDAVADRDLAIVWAAARRVANPPRDQIAHTIMVYSWSTDAMTDMASPVEAYDLADMVIAALGITEDTG